MTERRYWTSMEERAWGPLEAEGEPRSSIPDVPTRVSRRDFLKAAGFTCATGVVASCGPAPVEKAIPYLNQPVEVTPGRAYYYASTCGACAAGCGVLVKCRDGRPIKLEGNPAHPLSRGGLCAVGQASLLGLYDSRRLKAPLRGGKASSWQQVDAEVVSRLESIRGGGGAVRFVTGSCTGPTTRRLIEGFLDTFDDARHIVLEPLSCSAILDAHQRTHLRRALPHFRFDKAQVIVSFDADFLGAWISPVEFTSGYRASRRLGEEPPRFSYHVQFESRLSLTGTKADRRIVLEPVDLGPVLSRLTALVAEAAGAAFDDGQSVDLPVEEAELSSLARRLWSHRGECLVVCGSQETDVQILCNYLNHLLGNYGRTLDIARPSYQRQASDGEAQGLLRELEDRRVAALFLHGVNPVYALPKGDALARALREVPLIVSFAERRDETARLAHFVCPEPHFLESWGDVEAVNGIVSFSQPAVRKLGDTRSLTETLAAWMGRARSAYEILRERWTDQSVWKRALDEGYLSVDRGPSGVDGFDEEAVRALAAPRPPTSEAFALVLYPEVALLDGRHADNPWLQELPDPVTKVTWGNTACLSPSAAQRLGVEQGDVVRIELASGEAALPVELPVVVQPGQHDGVVAVAMGYGSEATRRFADMGPKWLEGRSTVGPNGRVGVNAAPLLTVKADLFQYAGAPVRLSAVGRKQPLACTQTHHTVTVPLQLAPESAGPRPMIRETTLAALGEEAPEGAERHGGHGELWPEDHPYEGHRWGMVVDLTACTGCSACVIACQVENNIPVVGKDEVRLNREMHWLRIDRYYSEHEAGIDVTHQPMMCHQCDHAPCETVCPVLATVHSEEGLNEQVYNRCVGTRYCANNCPYKVRRFNWFEYSHGDLLQNMTLNPDVTVRSRGVMEKCSFCVQRIQEGRMEAKRAERSLRDGDIQTACQQSCPADAVVFGDMNDPESRLSRWMASRRHYRVLEEINVRPSVGYLAVVRNRDNGKGGRSDG